MTVRARHAVDAQQTDEASPQSHGLGICERLLSTSRNDVQPDLAIWESSHHPTRNARTFYAADSEGADLTAPGSISRLPDP